VHHAAVAERDPGMVDAAAGPLGEEHQVAYSNVPLSLRAGVSTVAEPPHDITPDDPATIAKKIAHADAKAMRARDGWCT
jgi:hypothetical protein